jgi:hypothetical protein
MITWMSVLTAIAVSFVIILLIRHNCELSRREHMKPVDKLSHEDYLGEFRAESDDLTSKRIEHAVHAILDIRKYEIELYWRRTTYFWAFIAVTYAACGTLAVTTVKEAHDAGAFDTPISSKFVANGLIWVVACFGLFLSVAWHLVNKGSKYWQENWENHLDLLENSYQGPLYKIVISRPDLAASEWCDRVIHLINGPEPFSVSKVNAALSFFNILVWIGILVHLVIARAYPDRVTPDQEIVFVIWGTILAIFVMISISKTNRTHRPSLRATKRESHISLEE